MPYAIEPVGGGFKVTSPNHPHGFSKKPQTKKTATKQEVAIKIHSGEDGKATPKRVGVKKK